MTMSERKCEGPLMLPVENRVEVFVLWTVALLIATKVANLSDKCTWRSLLTFETGPVRSNGYFVQPPHFTSEIN